MALSANIMRGGHSAIGAQAINGTSFSSSVAAAGSSQATATLISQDVAIVTGASGTNGVRLPAAQPGDSVKIVNSSASSLLVFPPTGAAITVPGTGLGSANASYSQTTFSVCEYTCVSSTQWAVNKSA